MTARSAAQNLLQRLVEAIPAAWQRDRVFRGAAIGAGITGALFLLRVVGPHAPALQPSPSTLVPAAVPYVAGPGGNATSPLPAQVPRIGPGHPLGDVMILPTPDGDRFGTIAAGDLPAGSSAKLSRKPGKPP